MTDDSHAAIGTAARRTFRNRLWNVAPPVLALAVLLVIHVRGYFQPVPKGSHRYRARVMAIAASLPHTSGNWHGKDVPLPRSAVSMLQPTVDYCRQFSNKRTGQSATLMIIDCSDTRNLTGHYPPNCYPGNGWILEKSMRRTWKMAGYSIPGMEYKFRRGSFDTQTEIYVDDFFVMPDGRFLRTEQEFIRHAGTFNDRFFGAAQVELTLPGTMLPTDRMKVFYQLIGPNWKLIDAILHGVIHDHA